MYLFHSDFSSCLESAEIWHAHSFCVEKRPSVFFFFHKRGKEASCKHALESPSPSNGVFLPSWQGHFFSHKKSWHAKFQQILSNLKNHYEIGTYAPLPRSSSIIQIDLKLLNDDIDHKRVKDINKHLIQTFGSHWANLHVILMEGHALPTLICCYIVPDVATSATSLKISEENDVRDKSLLCSCRYVQF